MPNFLGNTHLSNLNTKYYYASLEKGYNDCKDEKFYNAAEEKLKENHLNEEVSEQILKGLCYVYRKSLIQDYERDICKYLYYWLGNILIDKMKHNHVFQDVIRNLFNILKNQKGQICTASTYHIVVEKFKNIKLLFDYSKDYDSYMNQITDYNQPCNEKYQKYLQTYINTYNMFQRECQDKRTYYGYCDVFDEYFANKNRTLLSTWTCNPQDNEPEVEYPETDKTEEEPPRTNVIEGQSVALGEQFKGGREQVAEPPGSSHYLPHQDTFVSNNASDNSDDTPPSITSKSITGAVSVAGALVPSYLLYNYTPAGNLINKLLGRTTRMNHNPLSEAQLMNNFYQPEGFNSERSGYNISYRPV
ncbi:VIR protein [Plasmodium vivax]|uniref:VIR protein n=1 Tax=Plasmodium vivax TaxID=5855 RepID=A0A1G4E1Z7_PLAVI|nr:VIR protein [Plasmodium vivax]